VGQTRDRHEGWAQKHWRLLKEAFHIFADNHPIKFASAIAYFSLFALPSAFLIITFIAGLFFGRGVVYEELRSQLSKVIGDEGADILVRITQNFEEQAAESWWMTAIYVVVVFWLSTQLFRLFQNSLNQLWNIKPDFDSWWHKQLLERGITFALVLSCGLVFFASTLVEQALGMLTGLLGMNVMDTQAVSVITNIITAVFVLAWFTFMYVVLPFVRINWKPAVEGATFTTVMFYIGVLLLWQGVVKRDLEDFYAEVYPIILVALWIFYSALIFLYGAAFTRVCAREQNKSIEPAPHAYKFKLVRDDEFHERNM
jgi:membrane protein